MLCVLIVQFVECWSDLWSYVYFSQYASWLITDSTESICLSVSPSDICLLSYFHLALFRPQRLLCLVAHSDFFFFIIPLFSRVKSGLRDRESSERWIRLAKAPEVKAVVSVFLSLNVRDVPLGRRWRGELVRDCVSFIFLSFLSRDV